MPADDLIGRLKPASECVSILEAEIARLTRERDEARAQAERLKGVADRAIGAVGEWMGRAQKAERERDEARAAVQTHYDQRGDDRCHLDDLKLYRDVLGIEPDPYVTALPPEADMMESCRRYVRQRQCPAVAGSYPMPGGMTIAQLTEAVARRERERDEARAEADALLGLLVDEGDETPPLWYALVPYGGSPLGFAWHECETKDEAIAAVRRAAGPGPGAGEGD
jgi:hypothetical protein